MSGQAIAPHQTSPVEEFVDNILDPHRMNELARDMPSHIKPEMFKRNLLNAVMINPGLMDLPVGLLFREVSKAAALGLFLDPQLGEAYIVVAYSGKTKSKEPQLRIGYRGLIKLARQSGEVTSVYAHEVHAKDRFVCKLGTEKTIEHEPTMFGDRGEVIGYYAVMKVANGEHDFEAMSVAQIRVIRDRSDAYKAFVDKKIQSTPWSTDEGEMSKKTTIRRLMKRAPQSPELAEAIRIEDAAEYGETIAARTALAPPAPPPPSEIDDSGVLVRKIEKPKPRQERAYVEEPKTVAKGSEIIPPEPPAPPAEEPPPHPEYEGPDGDASPIYDNEPPAPDESDIAEDVPPIVDYYQQGYEAKKIGVPYNKPPGELREKGREDDLDKWRDGWGVAFKESKK
jgi:recombination protein RecT